MTGPNERALREFADMVAMEDSMTTSALRPHRLMAEHVWKALRTLGFESGRVLVHGDDPASYLGHPYAKGHGFGSLVATIGPADGSGYPVQAEKFTNAGENFDLVIAALPFNDVKFALPFHQDRRRVMQEVLTFVSLDLTKAGGMTVVLASHDLLDAPDTEARQVIADQADLVGAVRLPGGIQRNVAGTDTATDLIVLHRAPPGQRPRRIEFTDTTPIFIEGRILLLNTYFDERPDYVLGQIDIDPRTSGPNAMTVTADPRQFEADFGAALDDMATTSRREGLVYSARTRSGVLDIPGSEQLNAGGANRARPLARDRESETRESEPVVDENPERPELGLW
ncbi:hypothetical protein [Pengzhenrongella sicca]|uniref:Uncharacterized protein n=1 Tax=Pengzhenrongella sicca TaxID=2819238 RepID=A0A8A4ZC87_9MICO|nr:hypothetical protein [Pengzhenrongella sicca]QTE28629.1 hypothetical protein J4E96_14875 [Pengzhenrongella sicca]